MTKSVHGKEASAVFFVSNGQLHPIKSAAIYQILFRDPDFSLVSWIPDNLLTKFAYPLGDMISTASRHLDGTLFRYAGSSDIYLILEGKKRRISSPGVFNALGLDWQRIIVIPESFRYESGEVIE